VLVNELIDYIESGFTADEERIAEALVFHHPLQPFSPRYFEKDSPLFSYSPQSALAARKMLGIRVPPSPFITNGLIEPQELWRNVELDELCAFFGNPARFLLNKRLGIYLPGDDDLPGDEEPFELKGLEKYRLSNRLLEAKIHGRVGMPFSGVKASGILPHGTVGASLYDQLAAQVSQFAEKTKRLLHHRPLEPLELDLALRGFRITGRISDIYPQHLVRYQYAMAKATHRLRTWIHHLALNVAAQGDYPRESLLICLAPEKSRKDEWHCLLVKPSEYCSDLLSALLDLYWKGLTAPLPFFPITSWRYAEARVQKGKSRLAALEEARRSWQTSDFITGEADEPHYQLAFRGADPLDDAFEDLALEVYVPVFEHFREMNQ
jgi:exodeoxyribonuclease V gamma subunit